MSSDLPGAIKERILTFPEYRMGAHRVALILRDGRVIDNVVVAWGDEIVSVGGATSWGFSPEDVIDAEDRS